MAGHSKWANFRYRTGRPRGRSLVAGPGRGDSSSGAAHLLERVRYEGYGPGGAAVLVDCLTDNRSRTAVEVREVFACHGGHLGAAGSVSYLFNEVGLMLYPPGTNEARLMEVALEAGAEDVVPNANSSMEVLADPIEFDTVRALLVGGGFAPAAAEVTQRASTSAVLMGEAAVSMVKLLEALEDLNDVQNVYTNAEIPDEVLALL